MKTNNQAERVNNQLIEFRFIYLPQDSSLWGIQPQKYDLQLKKPELPSITSLHKQGHIYIWIGTSISTYLTYIDYNLM